MRKVTIVVPVLMISCQVSEEPKMGPVTAQMRIVAKARMKPIGLAAAAAKQLAAAVKN
jgi:hypothetical protein